jgi:aryl-alcohol dehydrogenase
MMITAAVTESASAPFALDDLHLDPPRAGEVLVRLAGTGVCHTDLAARDQVYPVPLPAVLGHEGAGVVQDVGDDVTDVEPGDHVVLTYDSCGSCPGCIRGRPARCADFSRYNFAGTRPDGSTPLRRASGEVYGWFFGQSSFATHAITTPRNTVPVRKDVPLHLLGPLGCAVQTGAGSVLNALRCEAGSSLAVFGAGSVGCAAVLAATLAGCTPIVVVSRNADRLRLAVELGATHVVRAGDNGADPVDAIREITDGGVDFSVETTAVPAVLRQAVDCLGQGGVCGHLGAAAPGTEVILDMSSLLFNRQIRGVVEGDSVPRLFIPALIELYRQGRFPFNKLITTYALSEINTAIGESPRRPTPKAVVTFD